MVVHGEGLHRVDMNRGCAHGAGLMQGLDVFEMGVHSDGLPRVGVHKMGVHRMCAHRVARVQRIEMRNVGGLGGGAISCSAALEQPVPATAAVRLAVCQVAAAVAATADAAAAAAAHR